MSKKMQYRQPIIVQKFVMGNWGASKGKMFSGGYPTQEQAIRALLKKLKFTVIYLAGYSNE